MLPLDLHEHEDDQLVISQSELWGESFTVLSKGGERKKKSNGVHHSLTGDRFVVGTHLAEFLGRESFNLCGSLKRRKIDVWKGDDTLVRLLRRRGIIFLGSTSVTLVKIDDVSEFVVSCLETKRKRNRPQRPNVNLPNFFPQKSA